MNSPVTPRKLPIAKALALVMLVVAGGAAVAVSLGGVPDWLPGAPKHGPIPGPVRPGLPVHTPGASGVPTMRPLGPVPGASAPNLPSAPSMQGVSSPFPPDAASAVPASGPAASPSVGPVPAAAPVGASVAPAAASEVATAHPAVAAPASSASAPASAAPAAASAPAMPTWTTYYQSVDAIRADTQKAAAELENLEIHHKIDEARKGNFGDAKAAASSQNNMASVGSPMMGMPPQPPTAPAPAKEKEPAPAPREPVVQEVSMTDGHWSAVLQLSTGARKVVTQGESVHGIGTIADIKLGQVLVERAGKTIALPFAGDGDDQAPAQASTQRSTSPNMMMPFPPNMR